MSLSAKKLLILIGLVELQRIEKRGEVFDAAEAYGNMNNGKSGMAVLGIMDAIEEELVELDALADELKIMLRNSLWDGDQ